MTIPAGQTACIYCPSSGDAETDPGDAANEVVVDGQTLYFWNEGTDNGGIPAGAIAYNVAAGLSTLAPSAKYWVETVTGNISSTVFIGNGDDVLVPVTIPVLVQFEKSSGVVDLVDFTPPAAAPSAADIKSALVAAGDGALAGVSLSDAIIKAGLAQHNTMVDHGSEAPIGLVWGDAQTLQAFLGSDSAS